MMKYISIYDIDIDPKEIRLNYIEGIEGLKESIKEFGVLTPIVVGKKKDGRYQLFNGYRRIKASNNDMIPAFIFEFNQQELDEMRQIRNF